MGDTPEQTRLLEQLREHIGEGRPCAREGCVSKVPWKSRKGAGKTRLYCSQACQPSSRWAIRNRPTG